MNRFDEQAAQWDENPMRVQAASGIADAMIAHLHLRGDQTLMDFGTGTGLIALKLQPHVAKIVAVDSSHGMLTVLNRKLRESKITAIETREWSVGQDTNSFPPFDVIVSSLTLHHVKDTHAVAKTFHQLLLPGGQLAVADLDEDNGEFHDDPHAAEHNGFNRDTLRKIFENAGFTSLSFHEAYTIVKPRPDGRQKSFPVFLMTATKP